jgi:LPXTG-motif cell wall-anchored protein
MDEPEVYGLPRNPQLSTRNLTESTALTTVGALAAVGVGLLGLRKRRMDEVAAEEEAP